MALDEMLNIAFYFKFLEAEHHRFRRNFHESNTLAMLRDTLLPTLLVGEIELTRHWE